MKGRNFKTYKQALRFAKKKANQLGKPVKLKTQDKKGRRFVTVKTRIIRPTKKRR